MKCIWEGNLFQVWDVVQLCRIIDNIHYWMINHFRPWVSKCLDAWRLAHEDESEDEDSADSSEDDDSGSEETEEGEIKESDDNKVRNPSSPRSRNTALLSPESVFWNLGREYRQVKSHVRSRSAGQ